MHLHFVNDVDHGRGSPRAPWWTTEHEAIPLGNLDVNEPGFGASRCHDPPPFGAPCGASNMNRVQSVVSGECMISFTLFLWLKESRCAICGLAGHSPVTIHNPCMKDSFRLISPPMWAPRARPGAWPSHQLGQQADAWRGLQPMS